MKLRKCTATLYFSDEGEGLYLRLESERSACLYQCREDGWIDIDGIPSYELLAELKAAREE